MIDKPVRGWTKGPVEFNSKGVRGDEFKRGQGIPFCALIWPTLTRLRDETLANGRLIADAFNTATRTGLTPSELEAQRDRLLEAATALVKRWDTPLWKDAEHTGVFIDNLRQAIAACERTIRKSRTVDDERYRRTHPERRTTSALHGRTDRQ